MISVCASTFWSLARRRRRLKRGEGGINTLGTRGVLLLRFWGSYCLFCARFFNVFFRDNESLHDIVGAGLFLVVDSNLAALTRDSCAFDEVDDQEVTVEACD